MNNQQLSLTRFKFSGFSQTKEEINHLISDSRVKIIAQLVLGINTTITALVAFFWQNLPPEVPLFYSRPWGQPQLANRVWVWILPGSSWLTTIVNLWLASRIYKKEPVLAISLVWAAALVVFLASVSLFEVIWLST